MSEPRGEAGVRSWPPMARIERMLGEPAIFGAAPGEERVRPFPVPHDTAFFSSAACRVVPPAGVECRGAWKSPGVRALRGDASSLLARRDGSLLLVVGVKMRIAVAFTPNPRCSEREGRTERFCPVHNAWNDARSFGSTDSIWNLTAVVRKLHRRWCEDGSASITTWRGSWGEEGGRGGWGMS